MNPSSPGFVRVKKFEQFQHYKNRCPPWIKLHRAVLSDYAFSRLQDASKAHLMLIWVLASECDNRLPADPAWIGQRIGASGPVDLKPLLDSGFLELEQDASAPLADCSVSARERRGEERESRERGEAEKNTAPAAPEQTAVATAEPSGEPTFGVLIQHTRKRLWAPDGKPPAEWTEGREISVYQYFAREGYSNSEILNAIEGLYWLQRKGLVDWLPKADKLSARVLYKRSGFRHLFGMAVDAGLKYGWSDSDPIGRTEEREREKRRDPADAGGIGDVVGGVIGTIGQRSGRSAANAR